MTKKATPKENAALKIQPSVDPRDMIVAYEKTMPTRGDCNRKVMRRMDLTAMESFILRYTPSDEQEARDFRMMLAAALLSK